MQDVIVDCTSGQVAVSTLSAAQAQALTQAQQQAADQEREVAQEQNFRQQQRAALAAVSAALHDASAPLDAAALPGLVHKLLATPPQPLSAPEVATLVRFVLRCLLP